MALREFDGGHVLVVKDTDDSRDMLRVALEYCGTLVMTAAVEEAFADPRDFAAPRLGD